MICQVILSIPCLPNHLFTRFSALLYTIDAFKNFGKLVGKYPDICERAHFIFVPGPQDRHAPKIYPRYSVSFYFSLENKSKTVK